MSALESPHKKMKMTIDSDDLVHLHLDHHIGSSLLKQQIRNNPFILTSLTRVESFTIEPRFEEAELIGFCEKYGTIYSKKDSIFLMKNGQTLELKNLAQVMEWEDDFDIQAARIELGTENDYIYVHCDFGLFKLEMNGNCVWVIDDLDEYISNLVYDATNKQIIYRYEKNMVHYRSSETGELVLCIEIPHLKTFCIGTGNQLFVLCEDFISYHPTTIMVFYGEKYSQSRTVTVLKEFSLNAMTIWNDRLILINTREKVMSPQELIYVNTKTGKTEDIYNFDKIHQYSCYNLFGKYLIRRSYDSVIVFELKLHSEHFDSIWSKEVHNLMKTLNIEVPQKCYSIIYNDFTLPKSIV